MILQVNNIYKNYRQGPTTIHVLKGLNLEMQEAETCAILGQSGSGKSTLLALLAGLDRPDSGSISIQGKEIQLLSQQQLTQFRAQHLGFIFQQFHLMKNLSALENVALPLEIQGKAQAQLLARTALAQVGLEQRLSHRPHQLSGGECQRVAIARAFVTRPPLLLADEPSGNLDDQTGLGVMDLLFQMVQEQKMTLILVTHNLALAQRCHKVCRLQEGQLC